jgi:hypothetical protein
MSQELKRALQLYGRALCRDPRRLRNVLNDLCGGRTREVKALLWGLEYAVAEAFLQAGPGDDWAALEVRLTRHLLQELPLEEKLARQIVGSWRAAVAGAPEGRAWPEVSLPLVQPGRGLTLMDLGSGQALRYGAWLLGLQGHTLGLRHALVSLEVNLKGLGAFLFQQGQGPWRILLGDGRCTPWARPRLDWDPIEVVGEAALEDGVLGLYSAHLGAQQCVLQNRLGRRILLPRCGGPPSLQDLNGPARALDSWVGDDWTDRGHTPAGAD